MSNRKLKATLSDVVEMIERAKEKLQDALSADGDSEGLSMLEDLDMSFDSLIADLEDAADNI